MACLRESRWLMRARLCRNGPHRRQADLACDAGSEDYIFAANESARAIVQASAKRGSLVPSINSPGRSDG